MNISNKEEDYIKQIGILSSWGEKYVTTTKLSLERRSTPAAITDMIKKLFKKGLVLYKRYQGVKLSKKGIYIAKITVRKERLWQVFLVNKLKLGLDIITEISEYLEHVSSDILINRLDDFLGNPIYSPFGEIIPNDKGEMDIRKASAPLILIREGENVIVTAMKENNPKLIQYFHKKGIYIGAKIMLIEKLPYDDSLDISIDGHSKVNISKKVAENIMVSI